MNENYCIERHANYSNLRSVFDIETNWRVGGESVVNVHWERNESIDPMDCWDHRVALKMLIHERPVHQQHLAVAVALYS